MEKYYTLNQVAMMTGLTTRTLRNYIKVNTLNGEKIDGVWKFTSEEIEEFVSNPNVKPSILAKNKSIIFDFLGETDKKLNELCVILDLHVDEDEAEGISSFFCDEISKNETGTVKFMFEKNRKNSRVILSGYEDIVMHLLNTYYNR